MGSVIEGCDCCGAGGTLGCTNCGETSLPPIMGFVLAGIGDGTGANCSEYNATWSLNIGLFTLVRNISGYCGWKYQITTSKWVVLELGFNTADADPNDINQFSLWFSDAAEVSFNLSGYSGNPDAFYGKTYASGAQCDQSSHVLNYGTATGLCTGWPSTLTVTMSS